MGKRIVATDLWGFFPCQYHDGLCERAIFNHPLCDMRGSPFVCNGGSARGRKQLQGGERSVEIGGGAG